MEGESLPPRPALVPGAPNSEFFTQAGGRLERWGSVGTHSSFCWGQKGAGMYPWMYQCEGFQRSLFRVLWTRTDPRPRM